MHPTLRRWGIWPPAWAVVVLVGAFALVRFDIAARRDAFQVEARIAQRVLSQRAAQHDAILATLVLLGPGLRPEERLPSVYPQLREVLRRDDGQSWNDPSLQAAETASRAAQHAAIARVDPGTRQYTLVLAGADAAGAAGATSAATGVGGGAVPAGPTSFALRIDAIRMVALEEWPLQHDGPVAATLTWAGQTIVLEPGEPASTRPAGLTAGFVFEKPLSSESQPFVLRLSRATGPAQWPWLVLAAWAAIAAIVMASIAAWVRARQERRRSEELLRMGRVSRLNALGEMAAGIAHELNQPLSAVVTSAQAAQRLLDDDEPDLAVARKAMAQAATQGRRAADVVARMRRMIEAPGASPQTRAVSLAASARRVLDLMEPELRRRGIDVRIDGDAPAAAADPVALEQVVHNLLDNAMHALDAIPAGDRRLTLQLESSGERAVLVVRDSGPGIAADALPHVFEPFYTTKQGGLGLGLSLCETLAHSMGGTLTAHHATPRGAEFRLALPLAQDKP